MSSRSCFFRSCCQLLNKRNKVPGLNTHYKFSCFLASSIFCNAYNHSNFLILIFYLSIIYTKYFVIYLYLYCSKKIILTQNTISTVACLPLIPNCVGTQLVGRLGWFLAFRTKHEEHKHDRPYWYRQRIR